MVSNGKNIIQDTYEKCKKAIVDGTAKQTNYLKNLYRPFTDTEISNEVSELLKIDNIPTKNHIQLSRKISGLLLLRLLVVYVAQTLFDNAFTADINASPRC